MACPATIMVSGQDCTSPNGESSLVTVRAFDPIADMGFGTHHRHRWEELTIRKTYLVILSIYKMMVGEVLLMIT